MRHLTSHMDAPGGRISSAIGTIQHPAGHYSQASGGRIHRSASVNMTVIGLISGTSYDAVDAAAARMWLAGDTLFLAPLGAYSVPIPAPLRERIAAALPPQPTT